MSSKHATLSTAFPFLAGAVTALLVQNFLQKKKERASRENAGATCPGNDLSLFYGDITALTTITDRRKFLSADMYGALVRDAVVCCVDIVLVRYNRQLQRKECLLVERSTEPVKGVWWWPGGRLLKGETFFAAAKRKAEQETGITNVKCIQVLGVWNTFFPTSAWDTATSQGTQTVNPVVLVEMIDAANNALSDETQQVKLDNTSENYRWISLDANQAVAAGEDKYVTESLLRLQAWNPEYILDGI